MTKVPRYAMKSYWGHSGREYRMPFHNKSMRLGEKCRKSGLCESQSLYIQQLKLLCKRTTSSISFPTVRHWIHALLATCGCDFFLPQEGGQSGAKRAPLMSWCFAIRWGCMKKFCSFGLQIPTIPRNKKNPGIFFRPLNKATNYIYIYTYVYLNVLK